MPAGLQAYDPFHDYLEGESPFQNIHILNNDSEEVRMEKARRQAFRNDANQFEDDAFWSSYIISEREAQKLERKTPSKRKRKADASDFEILEVPNSQSSPANLKRRPQSESVRGNNSSQLPTPGPSPEKRLSQDTSGGVIGAQTLWSNEDDLFVRDATERRATSYDPWLDGGDNDQESQDEDSELQKARERNRQHVVNNPPMYDICTIFVGDEHTPYSISVDKLKKCEFLHSRLQSSEELKRYVNLFEEADISAKAFSPILQFLREKDFTPRTMGQGELQKIEKVVLQEEKDDAVDIIAKVYYTASKIQFDALQLACVNKLKVLSPLSLTSVLAVALYATYVASSGDKAEEEMMEWLADYLAKCYYTLMSEEGATFVRVLRENKELRRRVIRKLHENPEMGWEGMDD